MIRILVLFFVFIFQQCFTVEQFKVENSEVTGEPVVPVGGYRYQ